MDGYSPPLRPAANAGRVALVSGGGTGSAGGAYVTGTTIVVDGGVDAWGIGEAPPPLEVVEP